MISIETNSDKRLSKSREGEVGHLIVYTIFFIKTPPTFTADPQEPSQGVKFENAFKVLTL